MTILVKATVEFEIEQDQTWAEIIKDFHKILDRSEGDIVVGNDDSMCTKTLEGWKMLKMIQFVDYLSELGYFVDYLKDRVADYADDEVFIADIDRLFFDAIEDKRLEFSQDEMEQ